MTRTRSFLAALMLGITAPLAAQEPAAQVNLPQDVADELVAFYNDSTTIRLDGGGAVPPGRSLRGDVAVLEGNLEVGGEVTGRLAVINGDLRLRPGARVGGEIAVTGGQIEGVEDATVEGSVTVFEERLRYVRERGSIRRVSAGDRDDEGFTSSLGFGRSRLTVRAGTNYNRIEGLPVMFGPIIETASSNPLRLEALAVWRTDDGFSLGTEDLGYRVRLEQYLGGRELYSLGATAHSLIEPVERWGLTDLESSLATFLLHQDVRDYFERTGWTAYGRIRVPDLPLTLRVEYVDEEHEPAAVGSPWSLTDNDGPWRPQPLAGEGRLRSVGATLTLDTRNDVRDPTHGWWVEARTRVGVEGALAVPEHDVEPAGDGERVLVPSRRFGSDVALGQLDVRRYSRVGPDVELALRAVAGGSLTGEALPPQFQHAPGGEGSLPGYRRFAVDCGAREVPARRADPEGEGPDVFPSYGCDRMALFQAELRGGFGWTVDLGGDEPGDRDWQWDSSVQFRPRWAAFLNAGRGWALDAPGTATVPRHDEATRLDVGLGLFVGDLGLYFAVPLAEEGHGINLFVRLDRRF